MESNAADQETEANSAKASPSPTEDDFVRSLATIHISRKKRN